MQSIWLSVCIKNCVATAEDLSIGDITKFLFGKYIQRSKSRTNWKIGSTA